MILLVFINGCNNQNIDKVNQSNEEQIEEIQIEVIKEEKLLKKDYTEYSCSYGSLCYERNKN